jgi:hypothetical protein
VHAHATLLAAGTGLWLELTNAPHGGASCPAARGAMGTAAILWAVPALCFLPVLYVTVIAWLGGASPRRERAPGRIGQRTCRLASPAARLALTAHPMTTA